MANLDYNQNIPAVNNNPSVDQPKMRTNTNNIYSIWAEDHITFRTDNSGLHQYMHMPAFTAPAVISTGATSEGSVLYTAAGVADAANPQLFFDNSNGSFQLSPIKAWAYCSGTVAFPADSVINNQANNITDVKRTSTGNYTVTIPANVLGSVDYGVLVTPYSSGSSSSIVVNVTINTATSFVITFREPSTGNAINVNFFAFQVLQI